MSELVKKWEKTGLLKGLDLEYDRQICAQALEQAGYMLMAEDSDKAAKVAPFVFPVVRQTVPALLDTTKEIDFESYVHSCITIIEGEMVNFDFKNKNPALRDPEVVFCRTVSDKLIEQFKGE